MRLVGDPDGIAALKAMAADQRDYMKFLIAEAGSNSDRTAPFKDKVGERWQLVVQPSGDLEVRKAP